MNLIEKLISGYPTGEAGVLDHVHKRNSHISQASSKRIKTVSYCMTRLRFTLADPFKYEVTKAL